MTDTAPLRRELTRLHGEFLALVDPHRALLWRHCRHLTGKAFDAEDLVQDTLLRAFAALGRSFQPPPAPLPWLIRIATNRWIDEIRRHRPESWADGVDVPVTATVDAVEIDEAAARLCALPPRERAAIALVDVLGHSAEEAAHALACSVGAVRAALHRGRARLRDASAATVTTLPTTTVDGNLVAAFCAAFNAHDVEAVRTLLAPATTVQVLGLVEEHSAEQTLSGSIPHTWQESGHARMEAVTIANEAMLVITYDDAPPGRVVRDLVRCTTADGRITGWRHYFFCPDVLRELAPLIGQRIDPIGYRY